MPFSIKKTPQINFLPLLLALFSCVVWPTNESVHAQTLQARITLASLSPARLKIEAEGPATDTWSFRNTYGGIIGLAKRVENFQVTGAPGETVAVRKLAPGEFRSTKKAARFSYEVRASEPSRLTEMSHVSWLNQERGFLMLADLLPQLRKEGIESTAAALEFNLPVGWTVASNAEPDNNQKYLVSDPERAVFFVGRSLRKQSQRIDSTEFVLVTSGEWAFVDSQVTKLAGKVLKEYSKITRHRLTGKSVLMLSPFTTPVGPERWSAETRGSNVVLLLGNDARPETLLGRLGVVLTHELFHLWVPNSLSLAGDYDWFFEGFTLYQALLTALYLRFISFEDYLDTIGRVYDSYCSTPEHDKLSLIETSERRWTTSSSLVYDKGMLVAMAYDLILRQTSVGKASVSDVYPQLFGSAGIQGNANQSIMKILDQPVGMELFSERYVAGAAGIDLQDLLKPYGLSVQSTSSGTRLVVQRELQTEQRRLLRSLGYSN